MSNDLYMNPATGDIDVASGTTIRLCDTVEELTRQRLEITLRTFLGEWFANTEFGVPYFQSIYGKGTKGATDVAIKNVINSVDGVTKLIYYKSTVDKALRKILIDFKVVGESGEIISLQGIDL